jgi:hypothetical protein
MRRLLACGLFLLVACGEGALGPSATGSGGTNPDGGSGPGPTIDIVSPSNGSEFEFENEDDHHHGDDRFSVKTNVKNAILAPQGQCSGRSGCGHLVLLIDGTACGTPNSSSAQVDLDGFFGRCTVPGGDHQFLVQLVDDAGNVLATSPTVAVHVVNRDHGAEHADGGDDHPDGGDDRGGGGGGGGGGNDDGPGHR